MHLNEIIQIMQNRVTRLHAERGEAALLGKLQRCDELDVEIAETQQTLVKLQSVANQ